VTYRSASSDVSSLCCAEFPFTPVISSGCYRYIASSVPSP
jgi:hypothetical protein